MSKPFCHLALHPFLSVESDAEVELLPQMGSPWFEIAGILVFQRCEAVCREMTLEPRRSEVLIPCAYEALRSHAM